MRDYQTKANQGALPDSITAEKLGAGEANSTLTESKTAVSSSGQALAPADGTAEVTTQLAMALAIYGAGGAGYHVDTGAINAYVLGPVSPKKSPPAYFDGFTIAFEPGTENTGASTVNVASLGVKAITQVGGDALTGGELSKKSAIRYNLSGDRFEVLSGHVNLIVFNSSGSYPKPSGLKKIKVTLVAGGAGGGGVSTIDNAIGCGGGAGGASIKMILASALLSSETVTIGAGGAGGLDTGANGSTGGTTSFGAHLSATGGVGGTGDTSLTSKEGVLGGIGSNGDINLSGGASGGTPGVASPSGFGGSSILGAGAPSSNTDGNPATPPGGGGSGGRRTGAVDREGGSGSIGVIIIEEFF